MMDTREESKMPTKIVYNFYGERLRVSREFEFGRR